MKLVFLAVLLLLQSQSGVAQTVPVTRLQPKTAGPLSFDISGPPRTAFEALGEKAGLTIIFDRNYRPALPSIKLNLQDVDIVQALDSISAAANVFWVPVGKQAIFIADNNATYHRDYDLARFKLVHLSGPKTAQELSDVMNALRQGVNLTALLAYPRANLLLWKDTPEKSAAADKRLAELSRQMFGAAATVDSIASYEKDASGNVFLMDGSGRNINSKLSEIQPAFPGSFSLDINQPTREAFAAIAAKAGLSIIFNRDYRPSPSTLTLKLKDMDIYEALDVMTMATGTFWTPLDSRTIYVVDSNSTMHRDYDPQIVDVIHLAGPKTPGELNEVMNTLRQTLNLTSMAANPGANSLIFRDTSDKVALAEQIIADLDAQLQGTSKSVSHAAAYETDPMGNVFVLDGSRRNMNPVVSQLAVTSAGPFSMDINNQPTRAAIETIAAKAGLSVIFDRDYRPTPPTLTLKLNDTPIYTALDMVSTALRIFWAPLDRRTIFVTDNNSTKHRDFDPLALEVIDLPGLQSEQELNDLMNGVRQVLNAPVMYAIPRTNSLVLRDTPSKVALAKSVIGDLRVSGAAVQTAAPPVISVLYLETDSLSSFSNTSNNAGLKSYSAPASTQLRPRTSDSFSLHMTEDARRAYEILGETAGLNVTFDSRFAAGQPAALHLENVNVIQALDQLGTQTHNFWQVVDSKTVYITPENVSSTRLYEPTVLKSFHLTNTPTADVNIIATIARVMFNIQDLMIDAASNTIDVRTRPTNMTLVEKLITALDRPSPAR